MPRDKSDNTSWYRRSTRTLWIFLAATSAILFLGLAFATTQRDTLNELWGSDASTSTDAETSSADESPDSVDDNRVFPEENDGMWSYDDDRGYGGVTAINPLRTGWPNDIDWKEAGEEELQVLSCWAPTRDEALSIARDGVELGDNFMSTDVPSGDERTMPAPFCELVPAF